MNIRHGYSKIMLFHSKNKARAIFSFIFSLVLAGALLFVLSGAASADTPSGCSAIGGATFNTATGEINIASGLNGNTLCTLYYDINDPSIVSYDSNTNSYTANKSIKIWGGSTLTIKDTTLRLNAGWEGQDMLHPGLLYNDIGTLKIENSTVESVNSAVRASIVATKQTGTDGPTFITDSRINNIYSVVSTSLSGGGALVKIDNSVFSNIYTLNPGYPISNSIIQNYTTTANDGVMYGNAFKVTIRNNNAGATQNFPIHYADNVSYSEVYDVNIANTNAAIYAKEKSVTGSINNNRVYRISGGSGIAVQLSDPNIYSSALPYMVQDNFVDNVAGHGIFVIGKPFVNVINNTVTGSGTGIKLRIIKNNITVKNNYFGNNFVGFLFDGDAQSDKSILSINDKFENNSYDIRIGQFEITTTNTPKFINAKYDLSKILISTGAYFYDYKYLDVKVVDTNNNPVNNTTVTITNNTDTNYPAINIEGAAKSSFTTGAGGHTSLPQDPANSVAIMDFWKTSTTQQEMNYTITASKDGKSATITNISPNETWYRTNPNQPMKTVVLNIGTGSGYIVDININQDGIIDIFDLRLVALHFGETTTSPYPRYDVNADGVVDILDIRQVAGGM